MEHIFVKNRNCKFPREAAEIEQMMSTFDPDNDVNFIKSPTKSCKLSELRKMADFKETKR